MAHKKLILIVLTVLVVIPLIGCGENARMTGAQRRYQRLLQQVRMEAAQESIEQGRLDYAILLLEELVQSDSAFSDVAREMLVQVRAARKEVAQARSDRFADLM